ncbi:hypothetical protein MSAN_02365300 [Mycena sanguinolenta]|uniref:Uncharacterized protein n=1 Tax=Mycena sanguinolenta TaxID=230812 RepID=A0A8H6X5C6_9AGAR|nr:hypothetical protein MSAN_02365300 [Mycena sanguinolenta]
MVALPQALQRLYRVAKAELKRRSDNFDAVNAKHSTSQIEEWEAREVDQKMEIDKKDGKLKLVSVFEVNFEKGPPTHAAAYAKLVQEELDVSIATASSVSDRRVGDSILITTALVVEKDQHYVRRMIAKRAEADLVNAARRRLYNSVTDFRTRLVARIPGLDKHILDINPEKPEKEALFLPSHFAPVTRSELNMQALGQVEYELRQGQAFDALGETRTAIRTLQYNLELKKTTIYGVGANTKAQNFLKTLHNDIHVGADTYRRARVALVKLGMPDDDPAMRKLPESWIWSTGRGTNLSEEDEAKWEAEMERVKWFRDRALRDRAVEEVALLEEEFTRATEWFKKTAKAWENLGDGSKGDEKKAGWRAYAYKQASMYKMMMAKCVQALRDAPAKIKEDEERERKKDEQRAEERKKAKEVKDAEKLRKKEKKREEGKRKETEKNQKGKKGKGTKGKEKGKEKEEKEEQTDDDDDYDSEFEYIVLASNPSPTNPELAQIRTHPELAIIPIPAVYNPP